MSEDFQHKNVARVALTIAVVIFVLGILGVYINIA